MAETKKKTTAKKTNAAAKKAPETAAAEKIEKTAAAEAPVAAQQVNMIVEEKKPPVKILYIDSAIANNEIRIGLGRSIYGSGKIFAVQREQFEGEFMTATIMDLIARKKLIVLSGLTDEERQLYGCYYGEGEVLTGEKMFDFFFNLDTEEAAEKFAALCPEHRRLVATRFVDAWQRGDNRVTRDKVEALNRISKENDPEGLFTIIVRDLNEKAE